LKPRALAVEHRDDERAAQGGKRQGRALGCLSAIGSWSRDAPGNGLDMGACTAADELGLLSLSTVFAKQTKATKSRP
jgi:hypothetical protein